MRVKRRYSIRFKFSGFCEKQIPRIRAFGTTKPGADSSRSFARLPTVLTFGLITLVDPDQCGQGVYQWTPLRVSTPYAHQSQVHYAGSASNPLESQLGDSMEYENSDRYLESVGPNGSGELQSHVLSIPPNQGQWAGRVSLHAVRK